MGRQAHHHFIPSSYLKGFTQDGEDSSSFWGVPINNDKAFPTKPTDACSMRDYYTVEHENSLIVEHWYANKIEPKINIALQHIKEHSKLPLPSDMPNLVLLLATLYVRTPSHRETVEAPLKHVQKVVDSMCEDIKFSNRHEFEYTKTDLISSELKLINTVIKYLNNKYYKLYIINDSEHDVITSDNPFILSHPNGGKNFYFGLNTPNIEICVPITRKAILVASNEPFKEDVFSASDEIIGLTNTKLIRFAKRFFYSSKQEIILVDDDINVYKHTICSNK